jgi:hypothetical protein
MRSRIYTKVIIGAFNLLFCFALTVAMPLYAEEAKPEQKDVKPVTTETAKPVEEEKPTGDFSISVLSQYIWRGYELSRNSIVIQPSATIGYKGFSANIWGNLDTRPYYAGSMPDKSYSNSLTETDITLAYNKTIGLINLGAGYIYYSLGSLNQDAPKRADMQELFLTIGLNTILSPTFTAYKEISHYRNWYFLLGVSHTFEFSKIVSLKLAASGSYLISEYADAALFNAGAGYGGYPKFDENAQATDDKFNNFHDGIVSVSLPIKPISYVTITPTISYVFPLSQDARYEMKGQGLKGAATNSERDSSFLYGGMTFSFSF